MVRNYWHPDRKSLSGPLPRLTVFNMIGFVRCRLAQSFMQIGSPEKEPHSTMNCCRRRLGRWWAARAAVLAARLPADRRRVETAAGGRLTIGVLDPVNLQVSEQKFDCGVRIDRASRRVLSRANAVFPNFAVLLALVARRMRPEDATATLSRSLMLRSKARVKGGALAAG